MEEKKDWLFFKLGDMEHEIFPTDKDLESFNVFLKSTGIQEDFNVATYSPLFDIVRVNNGDEPIRSIGVCKVKRLSWLKRLILKWLFAHTEK